MYYPDSVVDEVRSRNDIVSVIGSYITLHKSSSNYVGLCPFHNEKTPSFNVNPARQIFHCFGCHKGGNVFTFVMEYENVSFPEALRILADRVGYKLPEHSDSASERENRSKREKLLALYKEAAEHFYRKLRSDEGRKGLEYLVGRALSAATMKSFGLGYSDGTLYDTVKGRYDDMLLKESGLFTFRETGGVRDKFFDRVMFPIFDQNGKVIAFGGRVMGDAKPKYLNSPESPIFDKSRNLYNLNHARRSRKGYFILCEGYMDVIALTQAGFDCAIATLGTALTEAQAKLISRYTNRVALTYDSDEAGQKAINRAIPMLHDVGVSAAVVDMRPFKDPDEFIKALGAEEYERRIANAKTSFAFEMQFIAAKYPNRADNPADRTAFAKEVANWMLRFRDRLERSNYIAAFCKTYGFDESEFREMVNEELQRAPAKRPAAEDSQTVPREHINADGVATQDFGRKRMEEENVMRSQNFLMTILASHPKARAVVRKYLAPEELAGSVYRDMARRCFEAPPDHVIDVAEAVSRYETVEEQELVTKMLASDEAERTEDIRRAVSDTLLKVLTRYADEEIARAKAAGDDEAVFRLTRKKAELRNLPMNLRREEF